MAEQRAGGDGRGRPDSPTGGTAGRVPGARDAELPLGPLLAYAAFAILWWAGAGAVESMAPGTAVADLLETHGGWIFVVLGLLLLFFLFRAERRSRLRSQRKLEAAFATTTDPMAVVRLDDGVVVEANEGFRHTLGLSRSEVVGRAIERPGLWMNPEDPARLLTALRRSEPVRDFETALRSAEGEECPVLLSARPLEVDGDRQAVLLARDMTLQRRVQRQLEHQALHDSLTGLANRTLILDRVRQSLAHAGRRGHRVAGLVLDLDRFKTVNDNLGPTVGDQLLVEMARRLESAIRAEDTLGRVGADEFAVVLGGIERDRDPVSVAGRLQDVVSRPLAIEGHELALTASVGMALGDPERTRPDDLLRRAGIALRRAKEGGQGRRHVYDPQVDASEVRRLRLEADLRRAVERGQLELHFQPIIVLATGEIGGMEALVRWKHPELGLIFPLEVIPIAEESGLIRPVGRWVLDEALSWARRWNDSRGPAAPLRVAVNVSPGELDDPGFDASVRELLAARGVEPGLLELEVTESLLMRSLARLRSLKASGVRLALDDFGTGYSSLGYLARLDVDVIKIDRSFVREVGRNPQTTAITRAMVAIAEALELDVTAEGIETEEQHRRLVEIGCTHAQGYWFGRPVRPEEVEGMLHSPTPTPTPAR